VDKCCRQLKALMLNSAFVLAGYGTRHGASFQETAGEVQFLNTGHGQKPMAGGLLQDFYQY